MLDGIGQHHLRMKFGEVVSERVALEPDGIVAEPPAEMSPPGHPKLTMPGVPGGERVRSAK